MRLSFSILVVALVPVLAAAQAPSLDAVWDKMIPFDATNLVGTQFIARTTDNGFALFSGSKIEDQWSFLAIRTDSSGNMLSMASHPYYSDTDGGSAALSAWINKVISTADGGFIALGYKEVNNNIIENVHNQKMFLLRLDADARVVWERQYNKTDYTDFGCSIVETQDGGFITAGVCGEYYNEVVTNGRSLWITNINSEGRMVWDTTFVVIKGSGESHHRIIDVARTDDGYVFSYSGYVMKLNKNLEKQWEKSNSLPSLSIAHDRQNNLVVFGLSTNTTHSPPLTEITHLIFLYLDENGDYLRYYTTSRYGRTSVSMQKTAMVGDTFMVLSSLSGSNQWLTGSTLNDGVLWNDSNFIHRATDFLFLEDGSCLQTGLTFKPGAQIDSLFLEKVVFGPPVSVSGKSDDIRKSINPGTAIRIRQNNNTILLSGVSGAQLEFTWYSLDGKRVSAPAVRAVVNRECSIPLAGRALASGTHILQIITGNSEVIRRTIALTP